MLNGALARCCAVVLPLVLMGCAAANSIHHSFPGVIGSRVITVDAKQRHLIMTRDKAGNVRACAEAAPDVFSALSSSFAGGGLFGPTNREVEAAYSLAETAATIERTQTINLLREMMYRTCERYLSGALEKSQFLTLAARDHRSVVAFLAIEQLTGVVRPTATVISGPAVRAARQQSKELIALMRAYETERAAAQTALDTARTELASADTEVAIGEQKVKVCSLDTPPADPAANAAYLVCASKKQKVKDAEARLKSAQANQAALQPSLDELSNSLATATEAGASNYGGFPNPEKPNLDHLISIGQIVERITVGAGVDEALMFCIGYLARDNNYTSTRSTCDGIIQRKQERDNQFLSTNLNFQMTQQEQNTAIRSADDYRSFSKRARGVFSRTPEPEWSRRFDEFKAKTGLPLTCLARQICIEAFSSGTPGVNLYANQSAQWEDALTTWSDALDGGA